MKRLALLGALVTGLAFAGTDTSNSEKSSEVTPGHSHLEKRHGHKHHAGDVAKETGQGAEVKRDVKRLPNGDIQITRVHGRQSHGPGILRARRSHVRKDVIEKTPQGDVVKHDVKTK